MKAILRNLAFLGIFLAPAAWAGEVTYVASISGVTCGGCKAQVSKAFKTLAGVKSVRFEDGESKDLKMVVVTTDGSTEVKKEEAVASLGKDAASYEVKTWEKKKASES